MDPWGHDPLLGLFWATHACPDQDWRLVLYRKSCQQAQCFQRAFSLDLSGWDFEVQNRPKDQRVVISELDSTSHHLVRHSSLFQNVLQLLIVGQNARIVKVVDEFLTKIIQVLDCHKAPEVRVSWMQRNSEALG